jgi:hypothetical protein
MNLKPIKYFFLFSISIFFINNSFGQQIQRFQLYNFPNTFFNVIDFRDTSYCSAHISIYDDTVKNYFITKNERNKNIFLSNDNFIAIKYLNENYFLLNFHFPFLTIKYNVIPYLNPEFVIKALYILKKIKFSPRISDALRSSEEQKKYKRRGWSNIESSPHMLGLAMDLSYFTGQERDIVMRCTAQLGIHFLEHGGRGNHHIHLQDEWEWTGIKDYNTDELSGTLNRNVNQNYNILKPYFLETECVQSENDIILNFVSDKYEIIKIEIENSLGQKKAKITAGIFEPGKHAIAIRKDFLKKGAYIFKYFRNNLFFKEECEYIE